MLEFVFGFIIGFFAVFAFIVGNFAPAIVSIFFLIFYIIIKTVIKKYQNKKEADRIRKAQKWWNGKLNVNLI